MAKMKRKKVVKAIANTTRLVDLISSLDGIHSAKVITDEVTIKEIHLLTSLKSLFAVKMVRTAIYVKTGYLVDKKTIFRIARV